MGLVRSLELVHSKVLVLARSMELVLVRSKSSSCGRGQRKRTKKN
jgi:hypothetical protein